MSLPVHVFPVGVDPAHEESLECWCKPWAVDEPQDMPDSTRAILDHLRTRVEAEDDSPIVMHNTRVAS